MAKAFGARVITSVLSDEIAEKIKPLGADVIINSATQNVEEILKAEEERGTPVNVSMDCLSGETLGKSLPYMARGGYWIVISTLAGIETKLLLRPLLTKGLHLVGSMLRNRTPEFKAYILSELVKNVWPKLEDGTVKPSIYHVLPITEAEAAHAILERGENIALRAPIYFNDFLLRTIPISDDVIATDSYTIPPIESVNTSYTITIGDVTSIPLRMFCGFLKAIHSVLIICPRNMNTEYHAFHVRIPIPAIMTAKITGVILSLLPFLFRK